MSTMSSMSDIISDRREEIFADYNASVKRNKRRFNEGVDTATAEYIFPNQMEDANNIVDKIYKNKRRVISIQKKTKVGADGLMIEIAKLLTTHIDDDFVVNPANVRILTGMSNAGWEKDMIDKAPTCFKDKIFHHGKLSKADLTSLRNALIIIDEIDTGDKECQVLHNTLKEAGVLNVKHMQENNNRFVFISATMIKELYDLYPWGELHELYKMTIPTSYFGHQDFLKNGIVQEFYPLSEYTYKCKYKCDLIQCAFETSKPDELKSHLKNLHKLKDDPLNLHYINCDSNKILNADKWVQEDILDNYGNDFRVHLARVTAKIVDVVQNACIRKGVMFKNHTSTDRLSADEIKELFKDPLTQHIVLGVKGFFRRANLIPNRWKLRIGATHELYTKVVDNNVQIQGLTGRMTGYWRADIEGGHKTGPHRTSIKAIEEYEKTYLDPFGINSYQTSGFKKNKGNVSAGSTMLSSKNITNLKPVPLPIVVDPTDPATVPIVLISTPTEYNTIKRKGKEWDYSTIYSIIKAHRPDITEELDKIEKAGGKDQIVEPNTEASTYSVYITDFVNACTNNKNHKHVGNIKDKEKDTFQIYLDKIEHRIIVSIQYGSKTKTSSSK